jgi:hypothetical protein
MLRSFSTLTVAVALLGGAAVSAQQHAPVPRAGVVAAGHHGINTGSLSCKVAGGIGFVFGSTKALTCIFARTVGVAERYDGVIRRFGVDVGYTSEAEMVWQVTAPGLIAPDSLAGDYAGVAVQSAISAAIGDTVLLGGGNKQVTLQPVRVAGAQGLNAAGGLVEISLQAVK